ncbi:MAG: tetratricopeptide repeat protein [Cryomorphaceae bacterium]|nr:tetratricopeptide repeat protein [Cryomorphaceae bacterium]
MKNFKSLTLSLCFLQILSISLFSKTLQSQSLDSLYAVWEDQTQTDSARVQAYKEYIWDGFLFSNPDSAFVLAEALFAYAETHNFPRGENQGNMIKGIAVNILGEFKDASRYYQKSLKGSQAIDDKWGISEILICFGVLYDEQSDFPRALDYYNQALIIDEEIGNKGGMAMSLNNIGNILVDQGELTRALEHYERALAIDEEIGVKQGIAAELINIGSIYLSQGDTSLALENFERSRLINEEIEDLPGLAINLINIGNILWEKGEDAEALQQFKNALKVNERAGNKLGKANNLNTIGMFFLDQNKYELALNNCRESLEIAEGVGSPEAEKNAHRCLYHSYKAINDNNKALVHLEKMIILKDSIYNEENTKKLTRIEMQYEYKRKEAIAQAEQEKKDAIAAQKLKQQKFVRNSFMGGFAVVLFFAGVFLKQRNRIGKEKARSEALLLNILPEETAQELKEKGSSEAKLMDQTSVLFTDFKGFTAMSENLSPKDLVKDLHECFSEFDRICEKYGIEKIKTIGDAYMAAGGLPSPNRTHAADVVKAGLEMAAFVELGKANKIKQNLPFFEIRVGVHTGPVVAGIVGIKKFSYDIWGDTVNTAARMESSGAVGRVNVSQSTYEQIKDNPQFVFEKRGQINAKGKGLLEMWFVQLRSQQNVSR